MARLTLADLSPAVREQVMAQHGLVPCKSGASKVKPKQIGAAISPYADLLGDKLDTGFPGRMLREYQPIKGCTLHKGRKFRIDFAFPMEKVAIEFDGYRYHGFSKKGFKQGLERQNILVAHGWRVLRYTLTDVRDNLDAVMAEIGVALAAPVQVEAS
ncbi:MAG: endonuclease domain-containing protein [Acidithiobacillus sp.]